MQLQRKQFNHCPSGLHYTIELYLAQQLCFKNDDNDNNNNNGRAPIFSQEAG